METQRVPPDVHVLVKALRPILRMGLPLDPDFDDPALLGLRGVVARSIDRDERLSRVKALDQLLRKLLAYYPDDVLSEAARVLFGVTPGTRGATLTRRRGQAAEENHYDPDHFRKRVEPKILRQLAWQLHQDSQNYIPRGHQDPIPIEITGDTPYIAQGDVSNKEHAKHQEALSRLWSHVYALRAAILRVERLKAWPHDETEATLSQREMEKAFAARDQELQTVRVLVQAYLDTYGDTIQHGEAEYNAAGLLRLAGWVADGG